MTSIDPTSFSNLNNRNSKNTFKFNLISCNFCMHMKNESLVFNSLRFKVLNYSSIHLELPRGT